MNRRRNVAIWLGFAIVLAAAVTYLPLADRLPTLAEWIALGLFCVGLLVVAAGLARALRRGSIYRGRIAGSVLLALSLALTAFFSYGTFYLGRDLPASAGSPRVGQTAPDFALPDVEGREVSLADLLGGAAGGHGALLIFYRGYW